MEAYSRGDYYFMEMFVCHSFVSYQEAGGGVFLLRGNLISFPPSHLLYIPRATSAEKTIKSYTQTSISSSCLRNSCWQHTLLIPKAGCSERGRQTPAPPNLLPSFSQHQVHKPSPGWLAVSLSSGWARGFGRDITCQDPADKNTCLHPLKAFSTGKAAGEKGPACQQTITQI